MIMKKKKEWNRDPNTWNGRFYILGKRKDWNRYSNIWGRRFYIPEEQRKKILDLIKNKRL